MVHRALTQVIIIGGGFAGINAARSLRKRSDLRVILVDRNNYHLFQPLLYQTALSMLAPQDIARPVRQILRGQRNAEFILGEVCGIDKERRTVELIGGRQLQYDYLVLAPGAISTYFGNEDWARFAPSLKSVEDAVEIRGRLIRACEKAQESAILGATPRSLHVVVIGGGPTGVELAGNIADLSHKVLSKDYTHVRMGEISVTLLEGSPRILGTFPEDLQQKAMMHLEKVGVTAKTDCRVTKIEEGFVTIDAGRIAADLILWTAGVQPSTLTHVLGVELDKKGYVPVDEYLNPAGHKEIFVCGDIAAVTEHGKRIPGVAQPAIQMGTHAGELIIADLERKPRTPFHYFDKGDMATIGFTAAVARIAWPFRAHWSGIPAWLTWMAIHIAFLSGGGNRVATVVSWLYNLFTRSTRSQLVIPGVGGSSAAKQS